MKSDSSLLTGSVPKKLAAFALPLFLGNLLQALYNAVDMLVVGRIVGETGLAAISNASMLCYIINSLGLGLTMGARCWRPSSKARATRRANATACPCSCLRLCLPPSW